MEKKRSDLLVEDTMENILIVFDVNHVFPKEFTPTEKRDGWWKRMWSAARSWFGRRPVADVHCEPTAIEEDGNEVVAGSVPSGGSRASAAELQATAKP